MLSARRYHERKLTERSHSVLTVLCIHDELSSVAVNVFVHSCFCESINKVFSFFFRVFTVYAKILSTLNHIHTGVFCKK